MWLIILNMSRAILGEVKSAIRQALVPGHTSQGHVIWAIRIVIALVILIFILFLATQYGYVSSNNAAVVAALLALAGVLITQVVNSNIARSAQTQAQALADQRAQDDALQAYFERVGTLLVDKQLGCGPPSNNLSIVARAQTLAMLEGLDPTRKRIALLFLYESALIGSKNPAISLRSANLRGADLSMINLRRANLNGADLRGADLSRAKLSGIDLSRADLTEANLMRAGLSRAKCSRTELSKANLQGADLSRADLRGADLSEANLKAVDLHEADLRGTRLRGTELSDADLSGSKVTSTDQLNESRSLAGATMPDGVSRYFHSRLAVIPNHD
jgi:uncharacterized protein YjbI with pentapeptide repeats